jgi:[acyl-carrier-protein] S-malonyltransferase
MGAVAFIFPGQGSQTVGMGKDLWNNFTEAREVFEEADDALGFSISSLCFEGPQASLNLTSNTQPAILTVSIAALRVLEYRVGIEPNCFAGHSLGEYAALIAAQALTFCDGVTTVQKRGQYMQEAVPEGEGGMAAILGLERDAVETACKTATGGAVVTAANFNCPGQIVISGQIDALWRAMSLAEEMGARRIVSLPVSAPFHCALMIPAGKRLEEHLEGVSISELTRPVITNVEAVENHDAGRVKELLVKQVSHPVLWEDSVRTMLAQGVDTFVEIGPGKVLSGLVRKIDRSASVISVEDTKGLMGLENRLQEAV